MTSWVEEVRAALSDGPSGARRARQRSRFLVEAQGPRAGVWRELAVGVAAAALASLAVFWAWRQVNPTGLDEPTFQASAFVFNDASEVYLEPGAQAWVERAKGREAVVVLETGELTVRITSGRKNVWRFRAGPNQVVVRGTQFSMLWKPAARSLDVQVREGRVEVRTSDGQLRSVGAGERLSYTEAPAQVSPLQRGAVEAAEAGEVEVSDVSEVSHSLRPLPGARPSDARVAPKPDGAPALRPLPPSRGVEPVLEKRAPAALRPLPPEWRRHAEAGRFAKAVALVEEQGEAAAMADVSSEDLLLLADAARLTRRASLGRSALRAVRERFPQSPDSAEAAFRLGRLEFDEGRLQEAGAWFDQYVSTAPEGPFAAEALGRRLDAWRRSGDSRAAQAASDYLSRYPKGAYAQLAEQVLEAR